MLLTISGDYDEGVTPVPIPNTEVKPFSADGTWLVTARESRSSPDSNKSFAEQRSFFSCRKMAPVPIPNTEVKIRILNSRNSTQWSLLLFG